MTRDRASVLLLYPAALLVVVALAAVTVDLARVHLAHRQADDLAAATANDAVTVGLDTEGLRADGRYRLDPTRVAAVVEAHGDGADRSSLRQLDLSHRLVGERRVVIEVVARVPLGFADVLPGAGGPARVTASGRAEARLR